MIKAERTERDHFFEDGTYYKCRDVDGVPRRFIVKGADSDPWDDEICPICLIEDKSCEKNI